MGSENSKAIWCWKSNQDPWDQNQPPEWKEYPVEVSKKIEDAFQSGWSAVDIGDYIVRLESINIQQHKQDKNKQRPVKRIVPGQVQTDFREQRFLAEVPKMKTLNDPFGNLADFIKILEYKARPHYNFPTTKRVGGVLSVEHTVPTNIEQILPMIINGILEEAKKLGDKEVQDGETIAKYLEDKVAKDSSESKVEVFNRALFYVYTKETFVYSRVNRLLREENWSEMVNLLPFIYYLGCAFFSDTFKPPAKTKSLYRGARLSEDMLSQYDPSRVKYFSWNSFTSTSANKKKTYSFCNNPKPGERSVVFLIEHQSKSFSYSFESANLSTISNFPEEEEVLLPPGAVFQLLEVKRSSSSKDPDEIKLRLMSSIDLFAGASCRKNLQARKIQVAQSLKQMLETEGELKIISDLKNFEDVEVAVELLRGKLSVKKLVFVHCDFDTRSMNLLKNVLLELDLDLFGMMELCQFPAEDMTAIVEVLLKKNIKTLIMPPLLEDREIDMMFGYLAQTKVERFVLAHPDTPFIPSQEGNEIIFLPPLIGKLDNLYRIMLYIPLTRIRQLFLYKNELTPKNTTELIKGLCNSEVEVLYLEDTFKQSKELNLFFEGFGKTKVRELFFINSNEKLKDEEKYLKYLFESNIDFLSYSSPLGNNALKCFLDLLKRSKLTRLCLNLNFVDDDIQLQMVLESISQLKLKELHVNTKHFEKLYLLAPYLPRMSLLTLGISAVSAVATNLSQESLMELVASFTKTQIECVYFNLRKDNANYDIVAHFLGHLLQSRAQTKIKKIGYSERPSPKDKWALRLLGIELEVWFSPFSWPNLIIRD